jgi:hypothetical protein
MGHNTIIVDYFNTPLPPTGKSSRQKNQWRNFRIKLHFSSKRLNRHLQNSPPNNCRHFIQKSIELAPKQITL